MSLARGGSDSRVRLEIRLLSIAQPQWCTKIGMRFLRVILVMSAALFVTVFVTRAALVSAALILNLSGDLWLWNAPNQLKRLTYWGYNGAPVISPDSSRVAYLSTPKADIEELASPNPKYEVFVPGDNVYIMDLRSLKAT